MMTKIGSVAKVLGIGTVGAFIGAVGMVIGVVVAEAAVAMILDPVYAATLADWAEILDARTNGKNLSITINRKVPNKNEEEEF